MDAALMLLTNNGFEATPMSAIARKAGVATGTIYIYFQNKEELIKEIYMVQKELLAKNIAKDLDGTLPVKETIHKIWMDHVRYILAHPLRFRFLEQFSNSPHIDSITKDQAIRMLTDVTDQFERGRREGVIRQIPDELVYVHLFAPINALIKFYMGDSSRLSRDRISLTFDVTWSALSG